MIAAASRWCSRSSRVAPGSSWSRSTASRRSPMRSRPARARCPSRRSEGQSDSGPSCSAKAEHPVHPGSRVGILGPSQPPVINGLPAFAGNDAESVAERSGSHRRAKEMFDLEPGARVDELGDAAAVATFRVALVAQQAEAAARGGERREGIELLARLRGREVLLIDAKKLVALAAARR